MSYSKWSTASIFFIRTSPYANRIRITTSFSSNTSYHSKSIRCIINLITNS
nr:MAG TPA: hypothetical protein [Caudoviricetes sp.]